MVIQDLIKSDLKKNSESQHEYMNMNRADQWWGIKAVKFFYLISRHFMPSCNIFLFLRLAIVKPAVGSSITSLENSLNPVSDQISSTIINGLTRRDNLGC